MDLKSAKDEDTEVDLESGLVLTDDESKDVSTEGNRKQGKILLNKISCGFVGDCIKGEDRYSGFCKESKLTVVHMDRVRSIEIAVTWLLVKQRLIFHNLMVVISMIGCFDVASSLKLMEHLQK